MPVSDEVLEATFELRDRLADKGIYVSDRKMDISLGLMRAQASLLGASEVRSQHMDILEDILWLRPDQKATVRELVRSHVATWLKDLRAAIDIVDDAEAKMDEAIRGRGDRNSSVSQITKVGSRIKEITGQGGLIEELLQNQEAEEDAKKLSDRCEKIREKGLRAISTLI